MTNDQNNIDFLTRKNKAFYETNNKATRSSVFDRVVFPGSSNSSSESRPFQNSNPPRLVNADPSFKDKSRGAWQPSKLCFRCLSPSHLVANCRNVTRCKSCFGYGHVARFCRAHGKSSSKIYRRISRPNIVHSVPKESPPVNLCTATDHGASSSFNRASPSFTPPHLDPSAAIPPSPAPAPVSMANFAVDPRPHLPHGFDWIERVAPREPRRMRVFLGASGVKTNENMAIAITKPSVAKDDFPQLAGRLHSFLQAVHLVRHLEIQRCPLGDAYVRFGNPLERERLFQASPMPFGQYTLRFIKHDDGVNACATDMDREVWLMLLAYPNDYRSDEEIHKALSGFATLKHIHKSTNDAR